MKDLRFNSAFICFFVLAFSTGAKSQRSELSDFTKELSFVGTLQKKADDWLLVNIEGGGETRMFSEKHQIPFPSRSILTNVVTQKIPLDKLHYKTVRLEGVLTYDADKKVFSFNVDTLAGVAYETEYRMIIDGIITAYTTLLAYPNAKTHAQVTSALDQIIRGLEVLDSHVASDLRVLLDFSGAKMGKHWKRIFDYYAPIDPFEKLPQEPNGFNK